MDEKKAKEIKKQLISQIEKSIQGEQKNQLISQINSMSPKQLEKFLKQNNLANEGECIFCSIINKKIPSYEITQNKGATAVLEINPISTGHTIIIPKTHTNEITQEAQQLAAIVAESLKFLKPKNIEIIPTEMFGHKILNVLPVYENETINSKRKKANEDELKNIQKEIISSYEKTIKKQTQEEKPKPKKKKKPITDKTHWLPKRFP